MRLAIITVAILVLATVAGVGASECGYEYAGCVVTHERVRAHEAVRAHVNEHRVSSYADLCFQRHGATHCYGNNHAPWSSIVADAVGGFR